MSGLRMVGSSTLGPLLENSAMYGAGLWFSTVLACPRLATGSLVDLMYLRISTASV
uniref:Uncharacterized protein n=1 Tax=Rhizophora mucronata TaxID=61149 RepID=A0A2P2Q1W2_RHIMU